MWVFGLRGINRVLGLIRTIILARLLAPSDFGLLGIAMLAIATLETFSQTGFNAALIQKKDNVESYLDTAWTVSAIRGILLFLILFLTAPLVVSFFNSPQAMLVIKVIAVSTLLSGFTNIGIMFFQKDLEFNKQFFYELSATLVDLTVAVALAFIIRNVWALVWGGLAANFVRLVMSYILHPYRPRIRFNKVEFKELFGFGKWVMASSILIFLITQGDDIFVGKMLGVTALGLYQMAYLISNMPATEISHIISQVTFPAYSKMQGDIPRLKAAYLDVLKLTAFISIPLAGGIFILAPEFTLIFLGAKWMAMVPAIQILVLAGLVRSIQATTGPVFLAANRPRIEPRLQTVRLGVLVVLIYPLSVEWGILGTSVALFFSTFVSAVEFVFMVLKVTKCELRSFLKVIILPLINVLFMILIMLFIKLCTPLPGIWQLALSIGIGTISYLFVTYIFDRVLNYGMQRLIKAYFVLP